MISPQPGAPGDSLGRGRRPPLRALPAAVGAALIALVSAAPAHAESPVITMQARAANAEFLAFAPPPPDGAAAVCLVDSGVDLNPDTASNVVHREAMDGGEPGDVRSTKHGTSMAMTMGAPVNDWGGVGAWPHVRIVSVRALSPGEEAFPFHVYEQAVVRCDEASEAHRVAVVNLSLGGRGASPEHVARLSDRSRGAQRDGLNVVAAAGNAGGAPEYPAAIAEVFGVGGADAQGELCAFSARGGGVGLNAPGCGLDVGLPDGRPGYANGTSDSAAFTSAILAAMRSYRSDLAPIDAEALLLESARFVHGHRVLDVEAAFRAAGLTAVVEAGRERAPAGAPDAPPTRPTVGNGEAGRMRRVVRPPRPLLTAMRMRHGSLTIRTAGRPPGARLHARVSYRRRGEFGAGIRFVRSRSSRIRLRLPGPWRRVVLRFVSRDALSAPTVITPRSRHRRRSNSRRFTDR